jgi:hypothetical protein
MEYVTTRTSSPPFWRIAGPTYKSDGSGAGSAQCFWARLSGFVGGLNETTQRTVESNAATVVIRDTDKGFQS